MELRRLSALVNFLEINNWEFVAMNAPDYIIARDTLGNLIAVSWHNQFSPPFGFWAV